MEITINSKFKCDDDRIANTILQKHCDLSFLEIRGFVTSVICDIRDIAQADLIEMLDINNIANKDVRKTMSEYTINCLNSIKHKLVHGIYDPVEEMKELMVIDHEEELQKIATAWSHGFITGVEFGMLSYMPDKQKDDLFLPMNMLTTDDKEMARDFKAHNINKTPREVKQESVQWLGYVVNEIYQLWLNGNNKTKKDMQNNDLDKPNQSDNHPVTVH